MTTSESEKDKLTELQKALRIDRSAIAITNELIEIVKKQNSLFSSGNPCSHVLPKIYPNKYFIAQEYNENRNDLRQAIDGALEKLDVVSIASDDRYKNEKILCQIVALILGTPFGIYQLTANQNRNVYLELGLAIGLEKPFIVSSQKLGVVKS